MNLDRDTFRTKFSKDSTFPTFSQVLTNPSFELSDHIRITQPLIDFRRERRTTTVYGYNDTITIFAPTNWAFYFYHGETNILQQVVPMNLDRSTFKSNFSKDSTFPTFSQDFANPSFELSDHIRVTQPLIGDAAGEELKLEGKRRLRLTTFRSMTGTSIMMDA